MGKCKTIANKIVSKAKSKGNYHSNSPFRPFVLYVTLDLFTFQSHIITFNGITINIPISHIKFHTGTVKELKSRMYAL